MNAVTQSRCAGEFEGHQNHQNGMTLSLATSVVKAKCRGPFELAIATGHVTYLQLVASEKCNQHVGWRFNALESV